MARKTLILNTETRVDIPRYCLKWQANTLYTVDELRALVEAGQLTRDTEISHAGQYDYSPARYFSFADAIFPPARPLSLVSAQELASQPINALNAPVAPSSTHVTTMDEVRAMAARDPNDPRVIVLLTNIQEAARRDGLSTKQAMRRLLTDNVKLNQTLARSPVYRYVNETIQAHRFTALSAAIAVNAFLIFVGIKGDSYDRQGVLFSAIFSNLFLGFIAVFTAEVDRWLNLNPIKVGLGLSALSFLAFNMIMAYFLLLLNMVPAKLSFWQVVALLITGRVL